MSTHDRALKELFLLDKMNFIKDPEKLMKQKEKEMLVAVKELDFESAALLRDEIKMLRGEPVHEHSNSKPRKRR